MSLPIPSSPRARGATRILTSYYLTNGLSAALGFFLISTLVRFWLGPIAAAAASVGIIVCIPPDTAAPVRRKIGQLLPAPLLGLPLYAGVLLVHTSPWAMGLLLAASSFMAFLGGAWGKRGLPIVVSLMFAVLFAMASTARGTSESAFQGSLHFALGAGLYLVWSVLANARLNPRYRVQILADSLLTLGALMRLQAQQYQPIDAADATSPTPLVGQVLRQQAQLTDQLQSARDLLLESPNTPRRQQLASMLMMVLEVRDQLLASELDLDALRDQPGQHAVLDELHRIMNHLAAQVSDLADALLTGNPCPPFVNRRDALDALKRGHPGEQSPSAEEAPLPLVQGLANRMGHVNDEIARLVALARNEREPDLDAVRVAWQMFVSPTTWSWKPLLASWRWNAPPLRHAIRATLAITSAYVTSLFLPWTAHDYWILLTIVVVLRGSLAQTLERRNSRVGGTLIGCVVTGALLALHPSTLLQTLVIALAQALAHAFSIRRYLVAAVAATIMGLLQAHLINVGASPVFDVVERIADTLLGVAFAWVFSYFLPSWERHLVPTLVRRTLEAQAKHARVALSLGQLKAVDNEPEIAWRLARKEVYDSLSALVQASQRALSEPRAVRPPLEPLGRLLTHGYQLVAQLTSVKTMLATHRGRLQPQALYQPLEATAQDIDATLIQPGAAAPSQSPTPSAGNAWALPHVDVDLHPWALRRLNLAQDLARRMRQDADAVLQKPVD